MKVRVRIVGLGLIMILAGSVVAPPRIFGQEPAADTAKRKVKSKVVPAYPPLARQMNITGRVKIEATITAEGKVSSTKVMGGSPVLVDSAVEALKKWRFEPAPKDTTEIIEFEFNGQN